MSFFLLLKVFLSSFLDPSLVLPSGQNEVKVPLHEDKKHHATPEDADNREYEIIEFIGPIQHHDGAAWIYCHWSSSSPFFSLSPFSLFSFSSSFLLVISCLLFVVSSFVPTRRRNSSGAEAQLKGGLFSLCLSFALEEFLRVEAQQKKKKHSG